MRLILDDNDLRAIVREIVAETLSAIDWPQSRIALTEAEAAQACGVARHVLRDLRLGGKISGRRLGKKIVYTRSDLVAALSSVGSDSASNPARKKSPTNSNFGGTARG